MAVSALNWEIHKRRTHEIQMTSSTIRMKAITFHVIFCHVVPNCWRMKIKINITYFCTALQANVNHDHLFSWFRNLVCRHSAWLLGPEQSYVNTEKMQTCNHAQSRIEKTDTASKQLKTAHASNHATTMTVAVTLTWTKLMKTNYFPCTR